MYVILNRKRGLSKESKCKRVSGEFAEAASHGEAAGPSLSKAQLLLLAGKVLHFHPVLHCCVVLHVPLYLVGGTAATSWVVLCCIGVQWMYYLFIAAHPLGSSKIFC